jgi:hypothetical protein
MLKRFPLTIDFYTDTLCKIICSCWCDCSVLSRRCCLKLQKFETKPISKLGRKRTFDMVVVFIIINSQTFSNYKNMTFESFSEHRKPRLNYNFTATITDTTTRPTQVLLNTFTWYPLLVCRIR